MARAFGLAGSQAAGTFAAWGTPTVKFHQCRGALVGLDGGAAGAAKFVATREFLTAKDGGLYNTYVDGGKPDLATADLGNRWELEQIAMRLWPSASLIQGMNTALFDLVEKHKIDPARIAKVRIGLSEQAFGMHGGFDTYKAKFEALLSAHYTAAVILHDRALTLAQFEPARYDDPKLRAASRPSRSRSATIRRSRARRLLDIEMTDGATFRRAASTRSAHSKIRYRAPKSSTNSAPMRKTFARRAHRGCGRGGRAAGRFRLGAQADGPAARRRGPWPRRSD